MLKDGVINIDKPQGWTSHDVVAKIRGLMKVTKVGHAGTLDPMATGVLPICFGKGTKIVSFFLDAEKTYEAIIRLGEETETQDATGRVVSSYDVPSDILELIPGVLASFEGAYEQIPPMYSAIKIKGVPLYKTARLGVVVAREPRPVQILAIQLMGIEGRDVSFSVRCSKGTYVRTLCADIGTRLGVGGHLLSLRRTQSGMFPLGEAIEVEKFCDLYREGAWEGEVCSLNKVLRHLPAICIDDEQLWKIKEGVPIGLECLAQYDTFRRGHPIRFMDRHGDLLAVGIALLDSDEASERMGPFYKMKALLTDRS